MRDARRRPGCAGALPPPPSSHHRIMGLLSCLDDKRITPDIAPPWPPMAAKRRSARAASATAAHCACRRITTSRSSVSAEKQPVPCADVVERKQSEPSASAVNERREPCVGCRHRADGEHSCVVRAVRPSSDSERAWVLRRDPWARGLMHRLESDAAMFNHKPKGRRMK